MRSLEYSSILCLTLTLAGLAELEKVISPDVEGNIYGNSNEDSTQSEAIPVDKLEWYNRTNTSVIQKQYKVSSSLLTF